MYVARSILFLFKILYFLNMQHNVALQTPKDINIPEMYLKNIVGIFPRSSNRHAHCSATLLTKTSNVHCVMNFCRILFLCELLSEKT